MGYLAGVATVMTDKVLQTRNALSGATYCPAGTDDATDIKERLATLMSGAMSGGNVRPRTMSGRTTQMSVSGCPMCPGIVLHAQVECANAAD